MTRKLLFAAGLVAVAAFAYQAERKRISPHETISVDADGKTISITYGRPSLKGRTVGQEIAPYGQVWRLGADEATKMTLSSGAVFGNKIELQPGSYSLFAVPGPTKWTLVVNKLADQWGAFKYNQGEDLGRIEVPVQKTTAPVEEFTISLEKTSDKDVKLGFAWGSESVSTDVRFR